MKTSIEVLWQRAAVIFMSALLSACGTSNKARSRAVQTAAHPAIVRSSSYIDSEVKLAKAALSGVAANAALGSPAALEVEAANSRIESWAELKRQKDALDAFFNVSFDENQKRAQRIGAWRAGIGVGGLVAGIAGTVLLAANPANAVWAGALSGFAGGVAGINGVFDNNGYSREQIAALETAVARQYAEKSKDIKLETLLMYAKDTQISQDVWSAELSKQEAAIIELRALALTLRIPTVVTPP